MQNGLVQKKKMGGKAGKKKWMKQSDTTNYQLHELNETKKQFAENARPKSTGPMFKIQVEPDMAIKKKLDKDRFKVQAYEATSKVEKKLLKKLEKQKKQVDTESTEVDSTGARSKSTKQQKSQTTRLDPDVEADFDVWGVDPKELDILHEKPQIRTRKEIDMPKIIRPYGGQSYNPSQQDHIELMKILVHKAEEKKASYKTKSEKAQERAKLQLSKRAPQKAVSKKEKELFDEHDKIREEKRKAYELKHFDHMIGEADNKRRKQGNFGLT